MRSELEIFPALETEAGDFISANGITDVFLPTDDNENLIAGQKIGIYKIVREIGFGGMGAVDLAERSDGEFSQKVAIKRLRRELNVAPARCRKLRRRHSVSRDGIRRTRAD